MAKSENLYKNSKPHSTKYPAGPVDGHKTYATGESLPESRDEKRIGGSKKDISRGSNR